MGVWNIFKNPLYEYSINKARPSDETVWYEHVTYKLGIYNFWSIRALYYLDAIFSDMLSELWGGDRVHIDYIEEVWDPSFFFEERVDREDIMRIMAVILYGEVDIWGWFLGSLGSWSEECDTLDPWELRKYTSHLMELLSGDPVMESVTSFHWRIGYENLRKVVCIGLRSLARWWASETHHRCGLSRCDSREPWARFRHRIYITLRMIVWWHHGVNSRGIPYIRDSLSLSSSWVQNTSQKPVWVIFFLTLRVLV